MSDFNWPQYAEAVALDIFGAPNDDKSRPPNDVRFGNNGSVSFDYTRGVWFDNERGEGGGIQDVIRIFKGTEDRSEQIAYAEKCLQNLEHGVKPRRNGNGGAHQSYQREVEAVYPYHDAGGQISFEVIREIYRLPSGGYVLDGRGKRVKNIFQRRPLGDKTPIIPYRLPQLLAALGARQIICIPEGEKKVDCLYGLGFPATCNAGGSKKWRLEHTTFLQGADIVLLPDNDPAGRDHVDAIAASLVPVARRVRLLELPGLPEKGDIIDWVAAGGTAEEFARLLTAARDYPRNEDAKPLPLFPPMADAEPYPVDALGPILSRAVKAIASKEQVPLALAAQAVLAAASLAACAHADVMMPFGQTRPLSLFCATIAASGDRKSTTDGDALWPIHRREAVLREENISALREWKIAHTAWGAEKRKLESNKLEYQDRKTALACLGDEPERPLEPNLVSDSPTVEGLTKNWPNMHAALGIFSAEGSTFTAGYAMNEDNKLKTAASLSAVWDGSPIKRIRAGDGVSVLPGRRLALHLQIQPDAAAAFFSSPMLRDQGILSRILVARPNSLAGTRLYKEPAANYPIVLHTHDEVVAEMPFGAGSIEEFERLLVEVPAWAEGLPVAAKVFEAARFKKD